MKAPLINQRTANGFFAYWTQFSFVLAFLLIACKQQVVTQDENLIKEMPNASVYLNTKLNTKTYINYEYDFIFSFPDNVEIINDSIDGTVAALSLVVFKNSSEIYNRDSVYIRIYRKQDWVGDWQERENEYSRDLIKEDILLQMSGSEYTDPFVLKAIKSTIGFIDDQKTDFGLIK